MDIDERILNKIREIGYKHNEVKKISLFGSRARGDNSERSDIDLAIYFSGETNFNVIDEIEDIETLIKLDITIINDCLDEKFIANIKKEEVIIYMIKFENKFDNYKKAVERLEYVSLKLFDDENIIRDSLILRFELCYELSWKTLKEYLKYNGLTTETMPRPVFKVANEHNLIDNEQVWLDMIKSRNVTSHEYNEDYVILLAEKIKTEYLPEFQQLRNKFGIDNKTI